VHRGLQSQRDQAAREHQEVDQDRVRIPIATVNRDAGLTPKREAGVVAACAILVAGTRLIALSKTLWDWDEAWFCIALRDYNVALHHPHPPGFPLYIALGRLVQFVTRNDFHALQAINVVAAILLFPVVYLLARALRFEFWTALFGAMLFVFLPNVWFLGGTAFSDIPSLTLLLGAIALLMRGNRRAYFWGSLLLAIALSFRPQNALIAAYPWIAASIARYRGRRADPLLSAVVIATILVAAFGAAAYVTGFHNYVRVLRDHSEYVLNVDGYRNPVRPPTLHLIGVYLAKPFGGRTLIAVTALAFIGLFDDWRRSIRVLLIFAPLYLVGCFLFNPDSISRYAITYLPMTALLAASGARLIAAIISGGRAIVPVQAVIIAAIIGRFAMWTLPALREVSAHDAPPVQAMRWVMQRARATHSMIYVHAGMQPWAQEFLQPGGWTLIDYDLTVPDIAHLRDGPYIFEGISQTPDGVTFKRSRTQLSGIARPMCFEVSIDPVRELPKFAQGWHEIESDAEESWRWMGRSSKTFFLPLPENGKLSLFFEVPLDGKRRPVVDVTFNGNRIDRFECSTKFVARDYIVPSRLAEMNELRIDVSDVVNPAREHLSGDTRDLGLKLLRYSWKPLTTR
jgi:hypothetical protein